jgi:hypothetical protein
LRRRRYALPGLQCLDDETPPEMPPGFTNDDDAQRH